MKDMFMCLVLLNIKRI